MLFSVFLSYLPYTIVTAFTPGQNNIIALHAVGQGGWRAGKNVLWGIAAGFLCVMILCAVFCYELSKYIPAFSEVLKYIGAAYIAYLAVHIAISKPSYENERKMSFAKGFFLEFANIKIILYAITVYTGYVLPHTAQLSALLFHSAVITAVGIAGTLSWAAAGSIFQKFLKKYYRLFNIVMGIILLWCAVSLITGN